MEETLDLLFDRLLMMMTMIVSLCISFLQHNSKFVMISVHLEEPEKFVGMRYWSRSYIYIYILHVTDHFT